MKRPVAGLVVLYALGIAAGAWLWSDCGFWRWSFVGLLAVFLLRYRVAYSRIILFSLVFVAGVIACQQTRQTAAPHDILNLLGTRYQAAIVRGIVVSDAQGRSSFQLAVQAWQRDNDWQPATGRLFVFLRDRDENEETSPQATPDDRPSLRYGDEIECSLAVRPPPPCRNPHVFDFGRWLARQQIHLTGTIGARDYCHRLARDQANPVRALSLRLRDRFQQALAAGLEDEPKLAGVLAGMVLGERADIPPDTYVSFQQAGTFHVFAIAGLHVGLVAAVLLLGLRLLRVPKRWCGLIAIPILVLYVFATGARPGALRALTMAGVWLTAWALVRPVEHLNTIALAALLILLVAPLELFDGGFLLSFGVVLGLATLTPPIERQLRAWVGRDPLLPAELVPRWRRKIERPLVGLVRLVSGSIAAWIGLLPLLALYFNLFTPISVLANLIAIPALGVIIALGLLSILVHPLWAALAVTFNNANFFVLHVMLQTIEPLGRWPGGHWYVQAPRGWAVAAYYAILAVLLTNRLTGPHRRWLAASGSLALAAGLLLTAGSRAPAEITVLDVNQGAAAFVNVPGERADFLIDVGDDVGGARVVKPFLRGEGVDQLGAVILTRGTKGHVAGFGELLDEIPIGEVVCSGLGARSRYYREWLGQTTNAVPLRAVKAGDEWEVKGGLHLKVLHPPPDWKSTRSEDNALVLLLEHGTTRVLFLSDAGETVERELLRRYPELRAQVIVKGRHSGGPSATPEFLKQLQPRAVVLAAGPQFGHRAQLDLRARLQPLGIELYRTDEAGAIQLNLTPHGYTITTQLPSHP